MILSLGLILILGFIIGWLLSKIKIPGLVGMIIVGLLIGPYCLGLIDEKILSISTELRQVALVIILTRSGLNLDIDSLKKIGRPAILMSFIPATLEIIEEANNESTILPRHSAYLTISEGRFHQVKRMMHSLGCEVTYLKRISMGPLTLGDLKRNEYRKLTVEEISLLKS